MNEIFGEENFISNIVWKRKTGSGSQIDKVFSEHEYVLAYVKDSSVNQQWRILNDEDGHFTNPDNDTRGPWESCAITAPSKNRNPNQKYQIEVFFSQPNKSIETNLNLIDVFTYGENTIVFRKTSKEAENDTYYSEQLKYARFIRRWSYVPKSMKEIFNQGKVYLNDGNLPRFKKFKADYEGKALRSIYFSEFSTQQGSSELTELFGKPLVEYPKPLGLLKILLQATTDENDIILDFFAGSCTTAHAILQMVHNNKSKNPFIVVQLPETTKSDSLAKLDGYLTVADIGKERIRRAIKSLETNNAKMIPQLINDQLILDLGFKVYKYSKSNFQIWDSFEEKNKESVTRLFDNLSQPLIIGWQEKNLLAEIFLIEGFPLTSKVAYLEDHLHNQVYCVTASDFCDHNLFVCLDETIQPVTVDLLKMEKEDIFICLDSALSDELKARVKDKFQVHVI
jgi:adenine-specific DNA-methyltransferase